ncbi:MAG: dethiobiotin synthase [Deltaproteobacteria bacterium]|nr:dethiobiotin synthase [Deltaproteobacteria bacterium]
MKEPAASSRGLRLLVTGTDTGAGKTYFACLLGRRLAAAGIAVHPLKPVESGCAAGPGGEPFPADAAALRDAMAPRLPLGSVCGYAFSAPLSPHLAARGERVRIDTERFRRMADAAAEASDAVLVEGAGGIAVEIRDGYTFADLARDLSFPVLLVAGNRLGVLNHATLTIRYLRSEGIPLFGVVLNDLSPDPSPSRETNGDEVRRIAGDRYLGRVPFGATALPEGLFARFREIALSLRPSLPI